VGYTPQLAVGVWVGNADGAPMDSNLSGIAGAGPIWNRFMRAALADVAPQEFVQPSGIVQVEICILTGALADSACPADRRRLEVFAAEQLPPGAGADTDPIEVALSWPLDGQTLAGVIPVQGSASIPDFAHYLVEYGESFEPGAWGVVAGPVGQPVVDGELAQWNVAALAMDGPHVLRVVAVDRQGARFESAPVRVVVLHDATPTPTTPVTETSTPTETPSATPTETPNVLPSPSPSATPTETPNALPSPSPTATPTETPELLPTPTVPAPPLILAEIQQPLDGDVLAGLVSVTGTAAGPAFASYALETLIDGIWTPIAPDAPVVFTSAVGLLGMWDTTILPNGVYTLRLLVNGTGGEVAVDTVTVTISN
jgi:membrane peptidoglycan carboxypeptidase